MFMRHSWIILQFVIMLCVGRYNADNDNNNRGNSADNNIEQLFVHLKVFIFLSRVSQIFMNKKIFPLWPYSFRRSFANPHSMRRHYRLSFFVTHNSEFPLIKSVSVRVHRAVLLIPLCLRKSIFGFMRRIVHASTSEQLHLLWCPTLWRFCVMSFNLINWGEYQLKLVQVFARSSRKPPRFSFILCLIQASFPSMLGCTPFLYQWRRSSVNRL